jgi:hypothetical protein
MEIILSLSGITAAFLWVFHKYKVNTFFLNKCYTCATFEMGFAVWIGYLFAMLIAGCYEDLTIYVNPFSIWIPTFFMTKLLNTNEE